MMNFWILAVAAFLYLIFAFWYFNWKGPLKSDEIESYVERITASQSPTDPNVLRKFMEEDDGKEFVMLNLVRFHEGEVEHPETGDVSSGPELIQGYFEPFTKALFRQGGHPVLVSRKKGGYIDSWNTAADEGFHIVGMMRYRSRRDLMVLASDPKFADSHKFKLAAIDGTTSFPTQVQAGMYLSPKIWVPIILILLASLAQNAIFIFLPRT